MSSGLSAELLSLVLPLAITGAFTRILHFGQKTSCDSSLIVFCCSDFGLSRFTPDIDLIDWGMGGILKGGSLPAAMASASSRFNRANAPTAFT